MSDRAIVDEPARGLITEEAEDRLASFGPNALPRSAPVHLWVRVGRQRRSSIIYILLFALAFDVVIWISEGAHG